MTELAALLRELEQTWKRKGFDHGSRFVLGLEPDEVAYQLAAEGLPAPSEVVDWFSWHNGVLGFPNPLNSSVALVPCRFEPGNLAGCLGEAFGRRYSLSFAEKHARDNQEAGEKGQLTEPDFWWKPDWVPLMFANADVIAVDLSIGSDTVHVLAVGYDTGNHWIPVTESLADFVGSLLSAPEESWHYSATENRWVVDSRVLHESLPPRLASLL
jgi:hypothetical protein